MAVVGARKDVVTSDSNSSRCFFYNRQHCLRQHKKKNKQKKTKPLESRRNSFFFFFFLPGADVPHVCVRARTLCSFPCLANPNLSGGAAGVGEQQRGDNQCPFSAVTNSGRVWREVPESDARSLLAGVRKRDAAWQPSPDTFSAVANDACRSF